MDEELIEALDWVEYHSIRAERAEAENERLEDPIDDLKTPLILRQEKFLALYRPSPGTPLQGGG